MRLLLSHSDCIRRLRILTVSTVGAVGLVRVKSGITTGREFHPAQRNFFS